MRSEHWRSWWSARPSQHLRRCPTPWRWSPAQPRHKPHGLMWFWCVLLKTLQVYPLVNIQKAIENCHLFRGFSHWKWWFSITMLNYQRVVTQKDSKSRKKMHPWSQRAFEGEQCRPWGSFSNPWRSMPLVSEFDLSAIHDMLGYGAFCIKSNMMTDPRECPITATWQS